MSRLPVVVRASAALLAFAATDALQTVTTTYHASARSPRPAYHPLHAAAGHAGRVPAALCHARSPQPCAKILSRNKVDFTSFDAGNQEFGLQGNVLGLAPKSDSGVLIFLAWLVARSKRIPVPDMAFAFAFPAYLVLANALRFDGNNVERPFKPLLREGRGPWFKRYVLSYALVGLLLPLPVVFFAPSAIALAAAPHLFLTLVQCALESLTAHARFAPLLRLAVPIGFNAYRLSSLATWTSTALGAALGSVGLAGSVWAWSALALAATNVMLWSYNLFVFLLLRVVPQYLDNAEFPTPTKRWQWELLPWSAKEADEAADTPAAAEEAAPA
jgi:hypothetical protein